MNQKLVNRLLIVATTLAVLSASAYLLLRDYLTSTLNVSGDGYTFVVERGDAFGSVAARLAGDGLLRAPGVLSGYARFTGQASRIQTVLAARHERPFKTWRVGDRDPARGKTLSTI